MYPKRSQPLDFALFKNPTSEYRGTPFWAWNCKLEKDELLRQIDVLREMGYGGFHMHVRTGMATDYLSDEYMELVSACVEKAREDKMLAWLYDEDRWPSGAAGGFVTKNPEHRIRHLLLTRTPYGQNAEAVRLVQSKATSVRTENGEFVACFDVQLDSAGSLESYKQIGENDIATGFKLYAYMETAESNPWFNNQTYADTLNPATIAEFIQVTYDRYKDYFADDFGGVIPAIFTDEPQFSHKTTLGFAQEHKDVTLPWTPDLAETFKAAYAGEELVSHLPELLWEKKDGISRTRYLYHDHIAERFAQAFADQCGSWCRQHGLMLTGHMMEEPTLESQTRALGEAMRSYRGFQLPGIDMLCNRYEYTTAKQAQSACHQYGNPGVMSELYGVTNWNYDLRGHKIQGDWQAALGVTVRVPHLSWVSMNGEAKRDYPGTFNYQAPWHDQYSLVEDHFARVNTAMTRGEAIVRIGVIHPVESYWLHWGAKETTRDIREQKDEQFLNLTKWLLCGLQDFDFIAESLLPDQCAVSAIDSAAFPVGKMKYDAIIVPNCETLRSTTLERLEKFKAAGGRIIFMGDAPTYVDAAISPRGRELYVTCETIGFERIALLNALEPLRELDIKGSSGSRTDSLIYQLRCDGDDRWLFIANRKDPDNPDLVAGEKLNIRFKGEWACTVYNTITGDITPTICTVHDGWTHIEYPFYDHDSLLVKFTKEPTGTPIAPPALTSETDLNMAGKNMTFNFEEKVQRFHGLVPVTLDEPNVLLLDMAQYRLDDEAYSDTEEILRLDNILRHRLNWPMRMEAVAQPWVETDESTPHTVTLKFSFDSLVDVEGARLCLERTDLAAIRLNGEEVAVNVSGWFVDKCIHTVDLPKISAGKVVLEVTYRYGRKVDLEALYLIGDFGVNAAGCSATLTEPVRALAFGDITRQGLPFYGGNITYHIEAEAVSNDMEITASCYRGHLISVAVDGEQKGKILFSPYKLKLSDIATGKHRIDLKYYGNRINTFGQLHCNNRDKGFWWGPNSWRTSAEEWTYEYRFWRQGILKSPEIV